MKDFVLEHAGKKPVSFHMPGHKGSDIFKHYGYENYLDSLIDCDITEIPGADNLFQAEGIIRDVQSRYQDLYGVERSYLLVNGTSGGIIASILASVKPGHKLVMARNCHKSVFNALELGGIEPVYARPEIIDEYGISGEVTPDEIKRCLSENPDADAVILPSPNYYGIVSDIEGIADAVHDAGKILIVDQAHGAHLKFFHKFGFGDDMPLCAEDSGADITINSIHKTLASITQSAVLNFNTNRVDRYILEDKLQMIETSSPSYIMMTFLDINAEILEKHGEEAIGNWNENLKWFERQLDNMPIKVVKRDNLDKTKINISLGNYGLSGAELEEELNNRGIYPELYAGDILMLMTGIGNSREDFERTIAALEEIIKDREVCGEREKFEGITAGLRKQAVMHGVPADKEYVPLDEAIGRVCGSSIIPYPPGIPLVCPGEEITDEAVEYVKELRNRGEKVIGVNDRGEVVVGI